MIPFTPKLIKKIQHLRLLVLDVDGVLTNGKITYTSDGTEFKTFHAHDGLGIKRLLATGVSIAIISSRESQTVTQRMKELKVPYVFQNQENKSDAFHSLLQELKLNIDSVACVGDDLPDLEIMQEASIAITVPNAVDTIKQQADWITHQSGGCGAVREICDTIIALQQNIHSGVHDSL